MFFVLKLKLCVLAMIELFIYIFGLLAPIIMQFVGYSSLCFANGGACTVVTCESDAQVAEEAKRNIVQAGAAEIVSYYYPSSIVVPQPFPCSNLALRWKFILDLHLNQ